ncbi:MAG: carboxypeptidase regulatory-like domain-containing protein, partial [Actinomycetales bacterium]|nr:carboxypeptidase regulatory-like domain-containing protein [Actinomycetales bacterium]
MFTLDRRFLSALVAAFALAFTALGTPAAVADETGVTVHGEVAAGASKLHNVDVDFLYCEGGVQAGISCNSEHQATTDENGEFQQVIPVGRPYVVRFSGDDETFPVQYWSSGSETVESIASATPYVGTAGEIAELQIQLVPGASISGKVLDIDGAVPSTVDIDVLDENDSSVKTGRQGDEDGFRIVGIPAGTYTVRFEFNGQKIDRSVTLERSDDYDFGDVRFTEPKIANVSKPEIHGDALVGETLTATNGTWEPADPALTYRWFADGELLEGETGSTFVVPLSALDKQIRVEVTASKPGFPASDTIESAPTDPISFEQIEVVTNPSVSGTPAVGATLTAQPGVWNPADVDLEYQWSVDGVEINGATGVTFVPQEAHAGKSVMVEVTASKLDFESARATSAPTSPLTIITLTNTAPPVISGMPTVGATLTATVGGWSASQGTWNQSGATITYTWYQGETEVSSGTSNTYVVPASAVGKAIVVTVTISKPGYRTTGIVVSAPTGFVPVPAVANVVNPSVVGVPVVGGVLTARPGAWSESGVTYSYRWFATGVAIAGATGSAYKVPVAHLGKQITVGVSASKTGFVKSVEARSVATA